MFVNFFAMFFRLSAFDNIKNIETFKHVRVKTKNVRKKNDNDKNRIRRTGPKVRQKVVTKVDI